MILLFYVLAICTIVWIVINTLCSYLDGDEHLFLFYLVAGLVAAIWVIWVTVEVIA